MFARTRYLGFALTIVFLGLVLWKVDLTELRSAFAAANYWLVVPAACCTLTGYLIRTGRWQQILVKTRLIPLRPLFSVLMIGFMANNVLPARMGEIVRAYALGRKAQVSKTLALATIVVERLCDGIALLCVLGVIALIFPLPSWGREAGIGASVVFFATAILLVVVLQREEWALASIGWLTRPLPRRIGSQVGSRASSFLAGLHALRSTRQVLAIGWTSLLVWTCEAASYYLILLGFHPKLQSGNLVIASLFMMVAVNLGIMIPSAPGYVGTFQFFGVLALSAFGVPQAQALGASIVSHASQWLLVTSIGLVAFMRESWSWSDVINRQSATGESLADAPLADP